MERNSGAFPGTKKAGDIVSALLSRNKSAPPLYFSRGHSAFLLMLLFAAILHAEPPEHKIIISQDTVFSDHFFIPENRTCIIKPGVKILFDDYRKIIVCGLLIAQGKPDAPIHFSCVDRPRGSTGSPCWTGFVIYGEKADALLRHCRIEGAYKNIIWEANPVFDSCEFAGNHYALYCIKKAAPHVKNCTIYRNVYGVVSDFAAPLLLNNLITENTVGVYLQLSAELVAGKNIIEKNDTNIRTEQCLGPTKKPLSLHYLWELMRELY
ncbi:MAG: hypothetical protein GF401_11120 [Chitinivibrionales bacterium]|nr:hypothetical protein [Chitinivibrionales bacterium]